MTDIVLINPTIRGECYPPLSLLCLASYARTKGFTVSIIDAHAERLSDAEICSKVKSENPMLCGMTFMTNQVPFAKSLLDLLKQEVDSFYIAGGVHTSVLPQEVLGMGFDGCVVGEGEITLVEIATALKNGRKPENIDGFWNGGIFKKREQIKDLGTLPLPAWDLAKMESYTVSQPDLRYTYERGVCLTLSTSRGCPFDCAFCSAHSVYGRGNRPRPILSVVDEIQMLVEQYGVDKFFIVDESIFWYKDRAELFAEEILRRGLKITYASSARVTDKGINLETLTKMRLSGLTRVDFGVESGSQRILDDICKHTTIEQIKKAHEIAHEAGLATTSLMIIGHLEETWDDIYKTFELIQNIPTEYPEFGPLTPYPATVVYEKAIERGWIRDDNWGNYYISLPYRVLRNGIFDYFDVWRAHIMATDAVKVISAYKNTKPKKFRDYLKLIKSHMRGLKPKGRYIMCKYTITGDKNYLKELNFNLVKGSRLHSIYEDKKKVEPYILHHRNSQIKKRPWMILKTEDKLHTMKYMAGVLIQVIYQSIPIHLLYYTTKLWLEDKDRIK